MGLIVAASSQLAIFNSLHSQSGEKGASISLRHAEAFHSVCGLILVALAIVGRNISAACEGDIPFQAAFALLALTTPLLLVRWIVPLRAYAETNSSRLLAETHSIEP